MRKQNRKPLPPDVAEAMRTKKMGKGGKWPVHKGRPLNQHLLPILNEMAANRCSYCGSWPMKDAAPTETIDHFKPKGTKRFPQHALTWENLLLACNTCQKSKGEKWHPNFLNPSDKDYRFEDWYVWDMATAELEPLHRKGTPECRRAQSMICACKLNRAGVLAVRKKFRTKRAVENHYRRQRGEPCESLEWAEGDWPIHR